VYESLNLFTPRPDKIGSGYLHFNWHSQRDQLVVNVAFMPIDGIKCYVLKKEWPFAYVVWRLICESIVGPFFADAFTLKQPGNSVAGLDSRRVTFLVQVVAVSWQGVRTVISKL
jgi:hypothetical protein